MRRVSPGGLLALLLPACALGGGCAGPAGPPGHYQFFGPADPGADPWYERVETWQGRARRDRVETVGTPASPATFLDPLPLKMGSFRADERRALARRVTEWARIQARHHYRKDVPEDVARDFWPTVRDLLDRNGDDCDGLDLIIHQLLREFGFGERELYRAIVRRDRDGLLHMVSLWFESPDDPWVLDATGAMTREMRRFSELRGWTPLKVFNETEQYTVRDLSLEPYARLER